MDSVQNEAKEMKCVICHGDTIEPRAVREELHIGDDIVYVTVDALVCTQCSERYFDRATVRKLENIERELQQTRESLPAIGKVLIYSEAA
jgi:YgiT-type zinc finger domain-containing protein